MSGFIKCPKCSKLSKRTTLCEYCGYEEESLTNSQKGPKKKPNKASYLGKVSVLCPVVMYFFLSLFGRLMADQEPDVARQMAMLGILLAFTFIGIGLTCAILGLRSGLKSKNFSGIIWAVVGLAINGVVALLWVAPLLAQL